MQLSAPRRRARGARPPALTSAVLLDRLPLSVADEVRGSPDLVAAAELAALELGAATDKGDAIARLGSTAFAGWLTLRGIDASALALVVQMGR